MIKKFLPNVNQKYKQRRAVAGAMDKVQTQEHKHTGNNLIQSIHSQAASLVFQPNKLGS